MEAPGVNPVPPSFGLQRASHRGGRRRRDRRFDQTLHDGTEPAERDDGEPEPAGSERPARPALQRSSPIVRRDEGDGLAHVDVLV